MITVPERQQSQEEIPQVKISKMLQLPRVRIACEVDQAVGLFSLLMIGRFFGELSTGEGLAVLLAPLLCWLTEIGGLQTKKPWLANIVRSLLVGIALLIVLFIAKRNFDREMGPLLVIKQQVESVPSQTEERSRAGSNVLITA